MQFHHAGVALFVYGTIIILRDDVHVVRGALRERRDRGVEVNHRVRGGDAHAFRVRGGETARPESCSNLRGARRLPFRAVRISRVEREVSRDDDVVNRTRLVQGDLQGGFVVGYVP